MDVSALRREAGAAGVMMIPIPGPGILQRVDGCEAARSVPGVVEVTISAKVGERLVPLPEGSSYLGFIFARGEAPETVEAALRAASEALTFIITPSLLAIPA